MGKRQPNAALSLVRAIIHYDYRGLDVSLQGKGKVEQPRWIAVPGRVAIQESPASDAEIATLQAFHQTLVKRLNIRVYSFKRTPTQAHRYSGAPTFELPFVKKAQAGDQECHDGCRLVNRPGISIRGSRLIMVFEKTHRLVLKVRVGAKMATDPGDITRVQPIVEPLVVGVFKSLLLQRPFAVP